MLRCHAPLSRKQSIKLNRLQAREGVAGLANNSSLDGAGLNGSVGVRHLGEGTLRGLVGGGAPVVAAGDGVAILLGVDGDEGLDDVVEDVVLDEDLGAHAGVDAGDGDILEVVVDDVDGAEADERAARADVAPVVVVVGDVQLARVLVGVGVGVADERVLVVVVEVDVGDGDVVGAVRDVEQAVVEVLVGGQVAGKVAVVDPDVGGAVDGDGVTAGVGLDLGDGQVADDDVLGVTDEQTDALKAGAGVNTKDGLRDRLADWT